MTYELSVKALTPFKIDFNALRANDQGKVVRECEQKFPAFLAQILHFPNLYFHMINLTPCDIIIVIIIIVFVMVLMDVERGLKEMKKKERKKMSVISAMDKVTDILAFNCTLAAVI